MNYRRTALFAVVVIVIALLAFAFSQQTVIQQSRQHSINVTTNRYDLRRSGTNTQETILNVSNVNPMQFGKLFTRAVVGDIYAQPLYLSNVEFADSVSHNVVYVATMHNNLYAFDADNPDESDPLWQVNFGPSFPVDKSSDIWDGEIGILSTPVIDLETKTIYVVNASYKDDPELPYYMLHALDIATGKEKFGGPTIIQATISASGAGSVDGKLSLNPRLSLQRPALALVNQRVYVMFGGFLDTRPFHGWIFSFSTANMSTPPLVWNTTPNGGDGGIWQAGTGLIADDAGNLYIVTGNGSFTVPEGGSDYGSSFVKLSTANNKLTAVDYFTPSDHLMLTQNDLDVGSSGPTMIAGTNLLLGGGKHGQVYVVESQNMGKFSQADNSHAKQAFGAFHGWLMSTPVSWVGPDRTHIYVFGDKDHLKDYAFVDGQINMNPVGRSVFAGNANRWPVMGVSSNGTMPNTGILWTVYPSTDRLGILRAVDATNVSRELWNSDMNGLRDQLGKIAKFNPPTIANGKVYVGTFSDELVVYGLLPLPATPLPDNAPIPAANGTGLQAEYFTDAALSAKGISRIDKNIDFDWKELPPDPSLLADNFSARWVGEIMPLTTGYYTFYIRADAAARLWVNNIAIIEHWIPEGNTEFSGVIFLQAGQKAPIKLEFFEDTGDASISLKWSGPQVPKSIVPQSQLFPDVTDDK
jgi:hypothetical protein